MSSQETHLLQEISDICNLPNIDLTSLEALKAKLDAVVTSGSFRNPGEMIECGKTVYLQGLNRLAGRPKVPDVNENIQDEEDKRIAPFIMEIGFALLELSCRIGTSSPSSRSKTPQTLLLQLLSISLRIGRIYFKAGLFEDAQKWLDVAAEKVRLVKSSPHASTDALCGIFTFTLYSASLQWKDYLASSSVSNKNGTAIRLVETAIASLPPSLRSSTQIIKDIVKTCKTLSALSLVPQDVKKWLEIGLRCVDEAMTSSSNSTDISLTRKKLLEAYQKDILHLLITATVQEKNEKEALTLILNSFDILKENSGFYLLWVKALFLSGNCSPADYTNVFDKALEHCHLQHQTKLSASKFQNLVALIFLISKSSSPSTAIPCVQKVLPLLAQSPVTSALVSSSSPSSPSTTLSVLSIHLLCEKDAPTALDQVRNVIQDAEWNPATKEGRLCLLLLWKHADKYAISRQWQAALDWYSLAENVLSINELDSKNKAVLCRKMAVCMYQLSRFEEALVVCEKSAKLDPCALVEYLFFTNLYKLGRKEEALRHLLCVAFLDHADLYISAANLATENKDRDSLLLILKETGKYMHLLQARSSGVVILRYLVYEQIEEFADILQDEELIASASKIADYLKMASSMLLSLKKSASASLSSASSVTWKAEIEGFFRSCWNIGLLAHQLLPLEYAIIHSIFINIPKFVSMLAAEDQTNLHTRSLKTSWFVLGSMSCLLSRAITEDDRDAKMILIERGLDELSNFDRFIADAPGDEEKNNLLEQKQSAAVIKFELLLAGGKESQALACVLHDDADIWCMKVAVQCLDVIVLIQPHQSSGSAIILLEKLLADMIRGEKGFIFDLFQYVEWCRLYVQIHLEQDSLEKLKDFFESLVTLLDHSAIALPQNEDLLRSDVLWMCIAVWNLSTDLWGLSFEVEAKQWMTLALKLANHCPGDCVQVQAMRSSYAEFLQEESAKDLER